MAAISPYQQARQRIVIGLFISQSLLSAALIASFTLTPIIAARLTGSESAAGVPSTLNLFGRAAIAFPMGWLMDRAGRRIGLSLGYLLGAAGSALSVLGVVSGSFVAFVLGAGLMGAARGTAEQSRFVAAEVQPPDLRARVIGLIVFAGTIGAVAGPLLVVPSGVWIGRWGLPAQAGPYAASIILVLVSMAVTFALLRPDPLQISRSLGEAMPSRTLGEAMQGHRPAPTAARSMRVIFRGGRVRLAVAAMLIGQLTMTLLMVITPLHMAHHEHTTQAISYVIMAHTLGMFGLSGLSGWLVDRFGRVAMIVAGSLVLCAAALLAPVSTQTAVLAAALFLLGLGWNFCFIAGSSLLQDELAASERGRGQGTGETLVALGTGLGSLGTGVLFDWGGMAAVSLVGLGCALLLMGLAGWMLVLRPAVRAVAAGEGD